jgi:hypothetical protein
MAMRGAKPKSGPAEQANLAFLREHGVELDPETGRVSAITLPQAEHYDQQDPAEDGGPDIEVVSVERTVNYDPLGDEADDHGLPGDPNPADDGRQSDHQQDPEPKGLDKRIQDSKDAQRSFSRAKAEAEALIEKVEKRQRFLDEQIQKLATLQATRGSIPTDLTPASDEEVAEFRKDYEPYLRVIHAAIAPIYSLVSELRERVDTLVRINGDNLAKEREDQVFGAIYKAIPKADLEKVLSSQGFLDWHRSLPPTIRNAYKDILENTSAYTAEDAFDVLKRYSYDTGVKVLKQSGERSTRRETPEMDSAPSLRSGGALPEAARSQRQQPNDAQPLSRAEQMSFTQLLQGHDVELTDGSVIYGARTEEEKAILRKRLTRTPMNFDGDRLVQSTR